MATYYDLKTTIGRMFGCEDIQNDTEDIDVNISQSCDGHNSSEIHFTISDLELMKIYNDVKEMENEQSNLYFDNYLEVPFTIINVNSMRQKRNATLYDKDNGIMYSFGNCSIEYCIFLLLKHIDGERIFPFFYHVNIKKLFDIYNQSCYTMNWIELLVEYFDIDTLKIKVDSNISLIELKKHKTAFEFNYMINTWETLIETKFIYSLGVGSSEITNRNMNEGNKLTLNSIPFKEYNEELVNYYRAGLISVDLYSRYLAFYHVLEYFFENIFRIYIVGVIKEKLKNSNFSPDDDNMVYEIVECVHENTVKNVNDEVGLGKDFNSLKLVITKYVKINSLKNRMKESVPSSLEYYSNNGVKFCDGTIIDWGNEQQVVHQISKRVYSIRNALVHSKDGSKFKRYKPFSSDEDELLLELTLIQSLAEEIIENSSKLIERSL